MPGGVPGLGPSPLRPAPEVGLGAAMGGAEDVSQLGARPLFDDTRLGWDTAPASRTMPAVQPHEPHVGTRLPSEGSYRIGPRTWWLVLALVILLGATATIAVLVAMT
jgi:hypothetical protein